MSRKENKKLFQKLFRNISFDVEEPTLDAVLDILSVQTHISTEQSEALNLEYQSVLYEKAVRLQELETMLEDMQLTLDDTRENLLIVNQQHSLRSEDLIDAWREIQDLKAALKQGHSQHVAEVRQLKRKNMEAYKLLLQMYNDITTRKKKLRIADYKVVLDNIVRRISKIMPKQAREEQKKKETLE